ncbi:phage virion morphogenesis protein [Ectopseudomonas oleovorans]|uniref:Virion morphogenesis protein n=1 Tax=Ectopseudomonas oleovorans (strain CECT 5344) TaxID=1182590 RepID=W6R2C0_ECTO5|nr:phage virion morphogenesis protein [Pseudomonas oleovorans]CDM42393.1 virion morphogenesis protein [Pseudomonas oleovorans CECT 5344]CDR93016.1 virion morphogenesis protein [Pseudomonas oleovorans]
MANRIEVQVIDAPVRQRVDQVLSVLTDSGVLMRGIAAELTAQTELAFQDEGPGWPQLKPATVKARARTGRGAHPILQVSNALARSITSQAGADFAQVGSNMPYAAIHQFGGTIERAPYSGKLRLRTDRKGQLLRRGKNGKLVTFAKEKGPRAHKNYVERRYEVKAHKIEIPARPYLPVTPSGLLTPRASDAIMELLTGLLMR